MDNEQEPAVKQPQKASKIPELVDTNSRDTDDEQGVVVKQSPKNIKNTKAC